MLNHLPNDFRSGLFVGRLQLPAGPTPVVLQAGRVIDVSAFAATVSQLLAAWPCDISAGIDLGDIADLALQPAWEAGGTGIRLLAPVDLQVVKASGVTFAVSAVERVIEERARGDVHAAQALRASLSARIGGDIRAVQPGSATAAHLKEVLIADGLWSQYLEVAIGPDAEIFTKAPVLSSVGWGDYVGVRSDSAWNNPEPEIVLLADATGRVLGATLGNDVNLRDIEGRSALLLGKAKDNNASCALGPFIRLFDSGFGIDDVRRAEVQLEITGDDGFRLSGGSSMSLISRDPLELVRQVVGTSHQYPDGFALFLGTMFAPIQDRGAVGQGFTHQIGDVVRVASERLGTLVNRVRTCEEAPPWTDGITALMLNLARRNLLR